MKYIMCFIVLAIVAGNTTANKMVFVSDSIWSDLYHTGGIAYFMSTHTDNEIVDECHSGWTTNDILSNLNRIKAQCPAEVYIEIGANDAAIDVGRTTQRVPPTQFTSNLKQIVSGLKASGCTVMLSTTSPHDYSTGTVWDYNGYNLRCANYFNGGTDCTQMYLYYDGLISSVAKTYGLKVFNHKAGIFQAFTAVPVSGTYDQYGNSQDYAINVDGEHLSGMGQSIVASELWGFINSATTTTTTTTSTSSTVSTSTTSTTSTTTTTLSGDGLSFYLTMEGRQYSCECT